MKMHKDTWLTKYTEGEIDIFKGMIEKMTESMSYEIYKEAQTKQQIKKENP